MKKIDVYTSVVAFRLPKKTKKELVEKISKQGLSLQVVFQQIAESYIQKQK